MVQNIKYVETFHLVHICAIVSVYQINTDKDTHILLNHHFIKAIRNTNVFQPLKRHLRGI